MKVRQTVLRITVPIAATLAALAISTGAASASAAHPLTSTASPAFTAGLGVSALAAAKNVTEGNGYQSVTAALIPAGHPCGGGMVATCQNVYPYSPCGTYVGTVYWQSVPLQDYVGLLGGTLTEYCSGVTAYLYLSWNSPFGHNVQVTHATYNHSAWTDVAYGVGYPPSNISVTVCDNYRGWHCGTPVHV